MIDSAFFQKKYVVYALKSAVLFGSIYLISIVYQFIIYNAFLASVVYKYTLPP